MIAQFNANGGNLQGGCDDAYAEVQSQLITRYNLTDEFKLTPPVAPAADTRNFLVKKITTIFAVRNILGSAQHLSEKQLMDFTHADKMIRDLRNGQANLNTGLVNEPAADFVTVLSPSLLVRDRFSQLG